MASTNENIKVVIGAENKTDGAFKGISGNLKSLDAVASGLTKTIGIGLAGAFGTAVSFAKSSFTAFAEAEKEMTTANKSLENAFAGLKEGSTISQTIIVGQQKISAGLKVTGADAEILKNKIDALNLAKQENANKLIKLQDLYSKQKISQEEYSLGVAKIENSTKTLSATEAKYVEILSEHDSKEVNITKTINLRIPTMEEAKKAMEEAGKTALKLGYDDEAASVSFAKLFSVTKDVSKAMDEQKLAMDLAAYSGRDLESATQALMTVHAGGTKILKEFGIEAKDNLTTQEAMDLVYQKVTGSAETMSKTTDAQLRILALSWGNLKEEVGSSLAEAITPFISTLTTWVQSDQAKTLLLELAEKFKELAIKLQPLIEASLPFFIDLLSKSVDAAIWLGDSIKSTTEFISNHGVIVDLATAALTILTTAFLTLKAVLLAQGVIGAIQSVSVAMGVATTSAGALRAALALIPVSLVITVALAGFALVMSQIRKLKDEIGEAQSSAMASADLDMTAIKKAKEYQASGETEKADRLLNVVKQHTNMPAMASGGIVTRPTTALIGEAGPEAVIPLNNLAGAGVGGITLNISGNTFMDDDAAEKFGDRLIQILKKELRI